MRLPVLLLGSRRAQRGQALVLGSLSFLVLALMVTLSFNLSHALRQKMSLQQHSDALAYSMAVVEARSLNFYAVSNRAIAGAYVGMNTLHAYMSAASVTGEMMRAAEGNFRQISGLEIIACACKGCQVHCQHSAEALKIASDFAQAGRDYDDKVRSLEDSFNRAIQGLDQLMDSLHASQRRVHAEALKAVKDGQSHGLSLLTEYNAPGASSLVEAVGRLNADEFNCAVDGMDCEGSVASTSAKARARVMTEVANASRAHWPATRTFSSKASVKKPPYLHQDFYQELEDIPDEGSYAVLQHQGTAKTVQRQSEVSGGGKQGGNEGTTVAAAEDGELFHQWKHGVGQSKYDVSVWSDSSSGGHKPGGAHSGSHSFEGANARSLEGCAQAGNCFMKFRANPDARRDWGQPRVYSYVTRPLRAGDTRKAPWELNSSARVELDHQAQGKGGITLAAGEGMGLSKGLVYYHRFGANGWRETPNLFSPYWRAKLHPFTPDEAARVLEAAGNQDAAELARVPGVSL